jgi:hypothetical protein
LKHATLQQPSLYNGSANKHVSAAIGICGDNGRDIVYAVRNEMLYAGAVSLRIAGVQ